MTDQIKAAWAGLVSVATTGGGLLWDQYALAAIGVLVGLLTIVERIYTIRIKRRDEKIRDLQLDQLTGPKEKTITSGGHHEH